MIGNQEGAGRWVWVFSLPSLSCEQGCNSVLNSLIESPYTHFGSSSMDISFLTTTVLDFRIQYRYIYSNNNARPALRPSPNSFCCKTVSTPFFPLALQPAFVFGARL